MPQGPFWSVHPTIQPNGVNLDGLFTQLAPALLYAAKIAVMFDGTPADPDGVREIKAEIDHLTTELMSSPQADWAFVDAHGICRVVKIQICKAGFPVLGTKPKGGERYPSIYASGGAWAALGFTPEAVALMADTIMDQYPAVKTWAMWHRDGISLNAPVPHSIPNDPSRLTEVVTALRNQSDYATQVDCYPPGSSVRIFRVVRSLPTWLTNWAIA